MTIAVEYVRVNFDTLILNLFFDCYVRRVTNANGVFSLLFSFSFLSKRDDDAKSDKDDKATTMMMMMNIVDKVISVNLHLLITAFMFMFILTILMLL